MKIEWNANAADDFRDSQANAPPAHQELVFCDYLNLITIRFSPINVYLKVF